MMQGLLEQGSAALGLCPDLGWVHKSGAEIPEFREEVF